MNKRTLSICGAAMFLVLLVSVAAWGYEKEIEQLSSQMAEKIAGKGKKTVAVVDFTDLEGNVTQLDRFIAEEFSVALAGAGKGFRVIDRTHLKSIIKENKLSATGLIDPVTVQNLGKIAGVDALVTGTLVLFADSVRVTIKVLDVNTSEVIDAYAGNISKTRAINELIGKKISDNILIDNFNHGNLLNWKPIYGDWIIENGQYTLREIEKDKLYVTSIDNTKLKNFVFSVDVSPGYISSASYRAGICPIIIDSKNFICFEVEGSKNKFDYSYWYIMKNGIYSDKISNNAIDTKYGELIQLRVEVYNGSCTAYINGNKISSIYDKMNSEKIGLSQWYEVWNYDRIRIKFDNVSVLPFF